MEGQHTMYEAAFDKDTRRDHAKTKGVDIAFFDKSKKSRSERKFAWRKAARAASGQEGDEDEDEEDEDEEDEEEGGDQQELPFRPA